MIAISSSRIPSECCRLAGRPQRWAASRMRMQTSGTCWRASSAVAMGLLVALWGATAFAATANITPSMDNTVAEDFPDNSSGACDSLFSGKTDNNFARRALMWFDVGAQIPPGSTIESVTLSMAVTRGSNHPDSTFTLHRVTTPWGEGTNGCGARGGGQGEDGPHPVGEGRGPGGARQAEGWKRASAEDQGFHLVAPFEDEGWGRGR